LDQTALVTQFDQYTGTDSAGSSVHALGRIEEPVRLSQNIVRQAYRFFDTTQRMHRTARAVCACVLVKLSHQC
ncbi:hypothetical protein QCD79_33910, partial [Pseudomonas quasicaspiana]|nr:hypothetical protein [Pseudomonas quasicaspiana]